MGFRTYNLTPNAATNLVSGAAEGDNLANGTLYSFQNKGPGHVAIHTATSAPSNNSLPTNPSIVIYPHQVFGLTVDTSEPPYAWSLTKNSKLDLVEG